MLRKGFRRDFLLFLEAVIDEIDAHSFSKQYRQLIFGPDYQRTSYFNAISRLLTLGDIKKVEKRGRAYYQLTSKGSKRIRENIPILRLAAKTWDRKWRIVIFDIPEKKKRLRESLRRKLIDLGFGRWQKSVYIIPHDIRDEINRFFKNQKLDHYCVCLEARRADLGDDRTLVDKVWNLDKIGDEYREFIWDCEELESLSIEERKDKVKDLWERYKGLIFKDPHLPAQLLPDNWPAEEARKKLRDVSS